MKNFRDTKMSDEELTTIYSYLRDDISRRQLTQQLQRTRTNTYYYVGRACHYWIKKGILRFKRVKDTAELGTGSEVE